MSKASQIAVVTGSSTGIGFETSLALARNGFHTYATMRNLDKSGKIMEIASNENLPLDVLRLDVTDDKSIKEAIGQVYDKNKRIDVLINNAGYALAGPLEETSTEEIKTQFETNFFGAIKTMQSVIPIMRNQKNGKIVNITSMGGRIAIPLDPIYHGTKFALEGLSECIRYELGLFNIKIILIEPGAVGSNFWNNIKMANKSENSISPYRNVVDTVSETFSKMSENVISPSEVANVIVEAVTTDTPEFRYVVGEDAKMIMEKNKTLPDREFENFIKEQFNLKY
ncbi:SDR family oxidoreductase [Candidatus Nitrosocosmicus agrestis]|jgi:short-subunit dehydrogenase|uniref:SDR family oxidoreductase n=1 Tax=Candidatus Nitrosocosmicus agrestis TaxID=2563600 RepID=UPI00122E6EB9|nr:SDR family oxidoreductase [Candidatus Nitrosocosmicus sp. SS]KAA2282481.1 SDR family oxidoreductase [Candidatus Nitrosocosmicus sp. SS]KAF0868747.1 SDR family oxidoreductase [Candidatus Nitrosocosmicus sp. SS]MDR4489665.1 SDR family oxidoreductase [Candidatus Nitrosocosmicus sp.]